MTVAGIDPGKDGALAIVHGDKSVEFFDVPKIKLRGKERPEWGTWWRSWTSALSFAMPDLIVIEDVAARPGQGVTSMFNFGRTLGFAHAIATFNGCTVQWVTPSVWKGKLGLLNSGKGASRAICGNLYPATVPQLKRAMDDGRAEAALLAHYGRKYLD